MSLMTTGMAAASNICGGQAHLQSPRKLPAGWHNFFMLGGGPVIFNDIGNGAISCGPLKNAGILQRPVAVELQPQTKLSWRWIVEELPSRLPEDQLTSHDYLSIAAEFDDGQDLTYFWSSSLPVGKAFRCPIPRLDTARIPHGGPHWTRRSRQVGQRRA
jgi:Protein of unknown function (DUF3047)